MFVWKQISRAIACLLLTGMVLCQPAFGQASPASTNPALDGNDVDVIDGSFNHAKEDASIGLQNGGPDTLKYIRIYGKAGWSDNMRSRINRTTEGGQLYVYVTIGGQSDKFLQSGSTYSPVIATGTTLVSTVSGSLTNFVYTDRSGTQYGFVENSAGSTLGIRIEYILYPTQDRESYYYRAQSLNGTRYERLQSVTNNVSWQIKFVFGSNTLSTGTTSEWQRISKVRTINNAVDYCDPLADSCSTAQSWPESNYGQSSDSGGIVRTAADPMGSTTTYLEDGGGRLVGIQRPGSLSPNIVIAYDGSGRVSSVSRDGSLYSYSYSDVADQRTTTVTNPDSSTMTYISSIQNNRLISITDSLSQTVFFQYDSFGRLSRITQPEGNYEQFDRDARGNITTRRRVAKPSSGTADIVEVFAFSASCTNVRTCNQPTSYTDALGNITTFTYHATAGALIAIKSPTLAGGQFIKQNHSFALKRAKVRNASGVLVDQSTNVFRKTSDCTTYLSNCIDSGEKVTHDYVADSNLLPGTIVRSGADGSLPLITSLGFDNIGNLIVEDGPQSGSADSTHYRYDLARRVVGRVMPDPDGIGPRMLGARRITYNVIGLPILREAGTVTSQSDAAWSAFSPSESVNIDYDVRGRKTKETLASASTIYKVEQFSYDAQDRLECHAVRMNPATYGSLPSSACVLGTTGPFGADQITKTVYDALGRTTSTIVAFGTPLQSVDAAYNYTANGQILHVDDAESNRTTFIYDGHDRWIEIRYPITTKGSLASSGTDRELFGYDANSNVVTHMLRDGSPILYTYDQVNRRLLKNLPGAEQDISYTYDFMSRVISSTQGSTTLQWTYNVDGKLTSASGPLGSISYGYDLAGRLIKTTWPDGFYVNYDYDVLNSVTKIRENGAMSGLGVLATYVYDDMGRRSSVTYGNGSVQTLQYDAVSRPASIINNLGGGATSHDLTQTFTYNSAGGIASVTRDNDAFAWQTHYNVDRAYIVDGLNRIMSAGPTALGYDARGNLTSSGTDIYSYSSENMLISGPGGTSVAYDPVGRLFDVTKASVHIKFLYDGNNIVGEYDGSGALQRRYVHGPNTDEPIVWYEGSAVGNATRRFLMTDERGSVVSVTDSSGATMAINSYDEYGIPSPANLGRFGYTGQTWIPEIGMWNFKTRMYSATLGRFMQTDPIGYADGLNLYNYVDSDPVNFADPTGLAEGSIVVSGTRPGPGPLGPIGGSSSFPTLALPVQGDPEKGNKPPRKKSKAPSDLDCAISAGLENIVDLGLDGAGILLLFAAPELQVAAAIGGSALSVIALGRSVVKKDAVGATVAFAGKQSANISGIAQAGSKLLRGATRLGIGALAVSTTRDLAEAVSDFRKCKAGSGK